jgi:transposase
MLEPDRLKCIQGLIDKQFKQKAVAERLGLTVRQVRRLVERYELEGPRGLISKLRDRPGNRRLKPERAEEAFAVIRAQYADFGPTLAAEKLRERHGIDLAVETVRSLMTAGGLWLPRRLRPQKSSNRDLAEPASANWFRSTAVSMHSLKIGRLSVRPWSTWMTQPVD